MSKTESLVERAYALRAQREQLALDLAEIEQALVDLGPGKHSGENEDHVVTVVAATEGTISYKLDPERLDDVKVLAGEDFAKLFDKKITFVPCKSFADVAPKLRPKRDAARLLDLLAKPVSGKAAHCRYKS